MRIGKILCAVCLIATGSLCFGAEWYVSISNGKNKNAGTAEAPLKNLWKALEKSAAGDTIYVAEGNYPGKMSKGWIEIEKPVSIFGGYSPDFKERDVLKHRTMLRPTNEQNATKPTFGTLTINTGDTFAKQKQFGPNALLVIDGFIFDQTDANNYHGTKGKPEGFADGMLTIPPAKGTKPNPSIDRYLVYGKTNGEVIIRNCLFLNGSNYALIIHHFEGKVKVINNVFIGNRMVAVDVLSSNAKPFVVEYEFANNTVLFTWTRTTEFSDMGYGIRANSKVVSNIHNNLIGLNCMAGFDNTKGAAKDKKIKFDNNVFFLNKKADVAITVSPNIKFMKAGDDGFDDLEDLDGMESVSGNTSLKDPSVFKGIIDEKYLNAFLSATYTETTDFDPNSPANIFRSALGMNQQGTITSKVSMFANPYDLESALKFFGALQGAGAQKPDQARIPGVLYNR